MGKVTLAIPDSEQAKISTEAEELNLSRSDYVRSRFRAGRLLWQNGDFDVELFIDSTLSEGVSGKSKGYGATLTEINKQDIRTSNNNRSSPSTLNDDISNDILRELPREGADKGVTEDELRELIFGSEEEQLNYIREVCKRLNEQNKITRAFEGGLVQKND